LGHRLLAHQGEVGKLGNGDALRRHEREYVRGRGADVVEACFAQCGVDRLGVLLVDQSQQQPDQRAGREVGGGFQRLAFRFQRSLGSRGRQLPVHYVRMDRHLSILPERSRNMSTPPAVYGQFGQALGLAERTLSANLRAHLAGRDTEPEAWYALQLIATRAPRLAREELTSVLESPNFDADSVRELLAQLKADGLITGNAEVDLTEEGDALHRSLREYIAGPTVELLSQFDVSEIETTVSTLKAITKSATERLDASGN
jgi:hypothetical protein